MKDEICGQLKLIMRSWTLAVDFTVSWFATRLVGWNLFCDGISGKISKSDAERVRV